MHCVSQQIHDKSDRINYRIYPMKYVRCIYPMKCFLLDYTPTETLFTSDIV